MADIALSEWLEKLGRCESRDDVHELNAGRVLLSDWDLVPYQTEHRQAAATRLAELTRQNRR